MTFGELVHNLESKPKLSLLCQLALYYFEEHFETDAITVNKVREIFRDAGENKAAKGNISQAMANARPYVHVAGKSSTGNLWALTDTGRSEIQQLVGDLSPKPEAVNNEVRLEELVKSLDQGVAAYVIEAVDCYKVDAQRAAIVFLWTGAVRSIQEQVVNCDTKEVDRVMNSRDPKCRKVRKIDHLCYIKESSLLLVAENLGLFDRNQRGMLEQCLDLRNKCGHPGKYRPGPHKVAAFIEDVTGIVFKPN